MKTPSSSRSGSAKPTLAQSARLHPYLPHKEALVNAYLNALDGDLFARGRVVDQRARVRESRATLARLQAELATRQAEQRALERELRVLEDKVSRVRAKDRIVRAWRRYVARRAGGRRAVDEREGVRVADKVGVAVEQVRDEGERSAEQHE